MAMLKERPCHVPCRQPGSFIVDVAQYGVDLAQLLLMRQARLTLLGGRVISKNAPRDIAVKYTMMPRASQGLLTPGWYQWRYRMPLAIR